jgi:hypothetical protein
MARAVGLYQQPWAELNAFIQAHGLELEAWEITAIREISDAYTDAVHEYLDCEKPAPYFDGVIDRAAVEQDVKRALRGK